MNHPLKGWIFEKGESKKGEWRVNHPYEGWIEKGWMGIMWIHKSRIAQAYKFSKKIAIFGYPIIYCDREVDDDANNSSENCEN